MTKVAMDYSKTIIYKIVCRDLEIKNCYVGHTTNFTKRKSAHKSDCKKRSYYVYQIIREHGGWDNWDMIMIEQYPCSNLVEASARERYWIEQLNADLNKVEPPTGLSKIEYDAKYRDNHKQYLSAYFKDYHIKNAEMIRDRVKNWQAKNIDYVIEQRKQYRAKNREEIIERKKHYYIKNIDKIKEQNKQRVCCIKCKLELAFSSLSAHYKTKH